MSDTTLTMRRPSRLREIGEVLLLPFASWSGAFAAVVLATVVLVAVFANALSPYDPLVNHFDAAGQLRRLEPPSAVHWLGTTYYGLDVLAQLIHGTRIVLIVGITCAVLIAQLRHKSRNLRLAPDERKEKARIMQRILRADAEIRCLAEPWLGDLEQLMDAKQVH